GVALMRRVTEDAERATYVPTHHDLERAPRLGDLEGRSLPPPPAHGCLRVSCASASWRPSSLSSCRPSAPISLYVRPSPEKSPRQDSPSRSRSVVGGGR